MPEKLYEIFIMNILYNYAEIIKKSIRRGPYAFFR